MSGSDLLGGLAGGHAADAGLDRTPIHGPAQHRVMIALPTSAMAPRTFLALRLRRRGGPFELSFGGFLRLTVPHTQDEPQEPGRGCVTRGVSARTTHS